jgi:hypothetical protein
VRVEKIGNGRINATVAQSGFDERPFPGAVFITMPMLEHAPAAAAESRAEWLDPRRAPFKQFDDRTTFAGPRDTRDLIGQEIRNVQPLTVRLDEALSMAADRASGDDDGLAHARSSFG